MPANNYSSSSQSSPKKPASIENKTDPSQINSATSASERANRFDQNIANLSSSSAPVKRSEYLPGDPIGKCVQVIGKFQLVFSKKNYQDGLKDLKKHLKDDGALAIISMVRPGEDYEQLKPKSIARYLVLSDWLGTLGVNADLKNIQRSIMYRDVYIYPRFVPCQCAD